MKYLLTILLFLSLTSSAQLLVGAAGVYYNPQCKTPSAITGTLSACVGLTSTLSDASTGGTWSSSSTTIASVGTSSGIVTGVASGTATISYATGQTCYATSTFSVNANPASITGTLTVATSATTQLTDATAGGTWSSSTTTVATIGTAGLVTGVASGTSTISYTLSTGCYVVATMTVTSGVTIGAPVFHAFKTPTVNAALAVTTTSATSSGTDMTVEVHDLQTASTGTLTDSKSNTWTQVASYNDGATTRITEWYCKNCTTGSGHTFSYSNASICYPTIFVQGWNNVSLTSPLNQINGRGIVAGTSATPGSITPTLNNCAVINSVNYFNGTSATTPTGYTLIDQCAFVANNNFACIVSYQNQTASTATNPSTTWTSSVTSTNAIMSINP